ncbi:L,D-transpeptidase [Rhodopseudomonas palustris]|uniref:ErfK/YbiS/YcfS/YnhG n=1 Tax=Rhodopseudomonas palustris (strain BisB18) TaxID=316056 RepID=Q219W9_RHOPB
MNPIILVVGLLCLAQPAYAAALQPDAINTAEFSGKIPTEDKLSPLAVKLQVLLDRAHFSPGEIDGRFGENVEKALAAYAEANALPPGKALTPEIWAKLKANSGDPVLAQYTLTAQDLKGPFLAKLPAKMEQMKTLKHLNYTGPKEALSERFHISQELLAELNPGQKFNRAGDAITIVSLPPEAMPTPATRLEVDKERQTVKAFAQDGSLLAFYPASVGSEEKPTPSGALKVDTVDANPNYRYNPKYKFSGVKSKKPFNIKPGPNNPVGAMWIGLSEPGYGIHGTADPSRVSKSDSHGCVRLTNWDVLRLSRMVKKGVEVAFVDDQQAAK